MNRKLDSREELLSLEISGCPEVHNAFGNKQHPCHEIVNWQKTKLPSLISVESLFDSDAHRPEAWAGNLGQAKILFLGSNPSFNENEAFPNYSDEWKNDKLSNFAARRFEASSSRPYGASDGPTTKEKDRVYLKSAKLHQSKVTHWNELRGNAAAILGIPKSEVSPNKDYVMTELVHCKSESEIGVTKALKTCSDKYLNKIFSVSKAKLIFILGSKPGKHFSSLIQMPDTWGYWKENGVPHGYWPTSNRELSEVRNAGKWSIKDQMLHTHEMNLFGMTRLVIWYPRPGRPQWPRKMLSETGPIDKEVLEFWRSKL